MLKFGESGDFTVVSFDGAAIRGGVFGMRAGRWKRLLFCGTGALMSPTSSGQGESIPGICHAVAIEAAR